MEGTRVCSSLSVMRNNPNGALLRCDWAVTGKIDSNVVDAKIVEGRVSDEGV